MTACCAALATSAGRYAHTAATTARSCNSSRNKSAVSSAHRCRFELMDTIDAINAIARNLPHLIYAMLTRGEKYVERHLGGWKSNAAAGWWRTRGAKPNASTWPPSQLRLR